MSGLASIFSAVVKRDSRLVARRMSEMAHPVLFFVIVVSLFPFGVGSDPLQLTKIGSGIIWVGALLATLLALEGLFRSDYDDGSLEQIILSGQPLTVVVLAKVFVHWCATGLPLIVVTPLLGVFLDLDSQVLIALLASLALGTPTLSLIGAVGIALTVSIKRSGLLLTLLVLPLYIPVLIFGAGVAAAAQAGLPTAGHFYLLGAMSVLSLVLAPIAAAAALRISVS